MKILHVNKFHHLRGGAERYLLDACEHSTRLGHRVAVFRSEHPDNLPSLWSEWDAPFVQTEVVRRTFGGAATAGALLYSWPARRRLGRMLDTFRPDIVHFHNIYHQLSSSVLDAVRIRGIPAVMTVHDYGIVAPNHSLFHDGRVCQCGVGDPFEVVRHRAVKGSLLASSLAATDRWLTRRRRAYERAIHTFLVPSLFSMELLQRAVFDGRMVHLPLFVDAARFPRVEGRERLGVLFVGRLVSGKGLEMVLSAAARLRTVPFRIVGGGPLAQTLARHIRQEKIQNVTMVGRLEGHSLAVEYGRAGAVLLPSDWIENFGLVALEAMATGAPVVAAETGGIGEIVTHGRTGVLFPPGDVEALIRELSVILARPDVAKEFGEAGYRRAVAEFGPDRHLAGLFAAYAQAMAG